MKNFSTIREDIKRNIVASGVASYVDKGSVIGQIADVISLELAKNHHILLNKEKALSVDEATGEALIKLAESYRIFPEPAKRATSTLAENNVYLQHRNNLDVSEWEDILDQVKTISTDNDIVYQVLRVGNYEPTDKRVYLSVRAIEPGSGSNVGSFKIKHHNLGDNSLIKVTNRFPIHNGENFESEDSIRFRIQERISSYSQGTSTAVRSELSTLAGIGKVAFIDSYKGNSTAAIIIQPSMGFQNNDLMLEQYQSVAMSFMPAGYDLIVMNPVLLQLKIGTVIRTFEVLNNDEKTELINRVENFIYNYIDDIRIGQALNLESMIGAIKTSIPEIEHIGGSPMEFDSVSVLLGNSSSSYELVIEENYVNAEQDELIIVANDSPFDIRVL